MKRLLLIPLLLFLLFGCSNNELVENVTVQLDEAKSLVAEKELQKALKLLNELEIKLADEKEEKLLADVQVEIERVKSLIAEERSYNNQLAKVLIDIYNSYGIIPENHQFHDSLGDLGFGIVYSQLIDFDHDGRNELYVLFRSSSYAGDELSHRNQYGYIEEVWGIQGNEPILLRHDMYDYLNESSASDLALSFIKLKDGTVAIQHKHEKTGQGIHNSIYWYYTLTNNQFVETEFYASSGSTYENIPSSFAINEKAIDEATFKEEKQKFEGEEQQIFISHGGPKEFVIDLSNPLNQVLNIVDQLTANNNELLLSSNTVEVSEELAEAIDKYKTFGNVDTRDQSYYSSMILSLILSGDLENDSPGQWPYDTAFSKEAVQTAMKKYFNIDKDLGTFGFSPISSRELLAYENDTLYLINTGLFSEYESISIPKKVVQVSEDVYYVKIEESSFNLWMFEEEHWDVDFMQFLDEPIENWPDIAKPYLTKELPTYLLLKKNGDEFQLLYKENLNLTDEELNKFLM